MEMLTPFLIKSLCALGTTELLCIAIRHKIKLKNQPVEKATSRLENAKSLGDYIGNDGLIISEDITMKQKYAFEHIGIFAPTGVGKTTRYFYPNLLNERLKGSIVVLDPKGELYRDTSQFQKEVCKRKVIRFEPLKFNCYEKYNLILQCNSDTEITNLAFDLLMNGSLSIELLTGKKTGGIEWVQMAEPLLCTALFYCKTLDKEYWTIENAFRLLIDNSNDDLDLLFSNSNSEQVKTYYNIYKTVANAKNTSSSIKITLSSNLKLFVDKLLNSNMTTTTFNADMLRNEECILYINYSENKANYLAPFIAPFLRQLIDKLIDNYNVASQPVYFMLDEFANIGMINNFQSYISTCRSRKISFSICLQSLTQLKQVYGRDNADTILSNIKTKILLSSLSDIYSLDYFENLLGKTVIKSISKSIDKNKNESSNQSDYIRNVMNKDEIRRIEDDYLVMIYGNKQPVKSRMLPYFKYEKFKSRIKINECNILQLPCRNTRKEYKSKPFAELINDRIKEFKEQLENKKMAERKKMREHEMKQIAVNEAKKKNKILDLLS